MSRHWHWLRWIVIPVAGLIFVLAGLIGWWMYKSSQPSPEHTKNIGDGWFYESLPAYLPEPGPAPSYLYHANGRKYVRVDSMIETYRFYEPDCVLYKTYRAYAEIFAVCGERVPFVVATGSAWKFDDDGLRRVSEAYSTGGNLVRDMDLVPLDNIKMLANRQPLFHRGWENSAKFESSPEPVTQQLPVDVQKAPPEGKQPALVEAVRSHRVDMVNALLRAGASPNERTDWGAVVIEMAAENGDLPVLDALIAAGADVNAQEPGTGTTALMRAAGIGQKEAVKRLLAAGADVNIRDSENQTAFDRIAPYSQDQEMLNMLRSK